jgi:hypothetical protein
MKGGEGMEDGQPKGTMHTAAPAGAAAMTGGRRKKSRVSRRGRKSKKGGQGVVATAALPFGLLALQRFFKGSRAAKHNVHEMGSSFKRTFRMPRKSGRKSARKTRRRRA